MTTLEFPASAPMPPSHPDLLQEVKDACEKIPPLWPLSHFVAVNPFVGLAHRDFAQAMGLIHQATHQASLLPASHFSELWRSGKISSGDVLEACRALGCATSASAGRSGPPDVWPEEQLFLSVADQADRKNGTRWAPLVVEEVSKWCAAYYDDGQSLWRMPWRHLSLFPAWKRGAERDHTLEVSGLRGVRSRIRSLPDDALLTIEAALREIGLPRDLWANYFLRLLMSVKGWAGYVQYLVRGHQMQGKPDSSLIDLLAIRIAYEAALHRASGIAPHIPASGGREPSVAAIWQEALEISHRRSWIAQLKPAPAGAGGRPSVQAVFCIDVRSEVIRRAVESADPAAETIGFAGFFGFPIEVVPPNQPAGGARCPVLINPSHTIQEHPPGATDAESRQAGVRLQAQDDLAGVWKSFKTSSITSFPFVESLGLAYSGSLLRESLVRPSRPASCPTALAVKKECCPPNGGGISCGDRVAMAAGALRNMGLTKNFARVVLLCGHGSQSANNPFASSLDCGACGGHAGDANARVAAQVLNDPAVRAALPEIGIAVPDDTIFVPGLHNTTTDEIALLDPEAVPLSHRDDLAALRSTLNQASDLARAERSISLGLDLPSSADLRQALEERARNWAEVRPEWGLAGNHAFIAAPRAATKNLHLDGRVFLHNYHPDHDPEFKILELILFAPMVVASWINLQYFASAANNDLFGSGNKLLHNAIGKIGVLEGNGGDLRTGLPWQSVHDGHQLRHLPMRLNVVIMAPPEAMDTILDRHPSVKDLVENRWLHLFALTGQGILRRQPGGSWAG